MRQSTLLFQQTNTAIPQKLPAVTRRKAQAESRHGCSQQFQQAQEEALTRLQQAAPFPGMVQPAAARAPLNAHYYLVMQRVKVKEEGEGKECK